MAKNDSSALDSKLKAIAVIVKELQNLEEAERQDVVDFSLKQVGLASSKGPVIGQVLDTKTISPMGNSSQPLHLTIDRFVSFKKPKDQYQRIAVLAYYIKHKENKTDFKNSEMETINTVDARQPKIGNMADTVTKAKLRNKFLTKGSIPASHQLSVLGEDVAEALPDQSKVAEIIASSKVVKTRKKGSKKKAK